DQPCASTNQPATGPTFYLFSVAAAVPGLILLLVCRQTLEYTRVNDNFISRTAYPAGYAFAMWTLAAGVSLLAVWLLLLTMDTLDLTHFSFLPALLEVGVLVALSGVVLTLRKLHCTSVFSLQEFLKVHLSHCQGARPEGQ
ncbi:hypothetical protein ACUOA8_12670, partial [Escherichia sp. SS-MK2]